MSLKKNCNYIFKNLNSLHLKPEVFNINNFALVIISVIICCYGLVINNQMIILGGKIIGLILIQYIGLSMYLCLSDSKNILHILYNLTIIIILSLSISTIYGYYIHKYNVLTEPTPEMLSRINDKSLLIDFIIAVFVGISLVFAISKKSILAIIGLSIIAATTPVLATSGLCYGAAISNKLHSNSNKLTDTTNPIKNIKDGNSSLLIFFTYLIGIVSGFALVMLIKCSFPIGTN